VIRVQSSPIIRANAALAPVRLTALHPFASAVTGLSSGAVAAILIPGGLGPALGLLALGAGAIGTFWLTERKGAAAREQVLAAIGEVKVRLATNAIRLDALSQRVEQMPMRDTDAAPARAAINELTAEVGLLGDLIHQLATTLADHDTALAVLARPPAAAAKPAPEPEAERRPGPEEQAAERARLARLAEERVTAERAAMISAALTEGGVEVHLQPIVQLPQRRTRGYEALARLRLDENTLLLPHEFTSVVEERGFGPTLDALVLTRALAIARHLGSKEGGLFVSCNFGRTTWGSPKALAALSRILDKYREHAAHLVIEVPQAVFRALNPTSLGLLGAMSANGVRFALDQLDDLRLDPVSLFDRGIRFVKAPADLLQGEVGRPTADIAVSDLPALLARASIALIVDRIEDDPTVADMIELGVAMAQGRVFSPPRPVKPEVFAEPEPEPAQAAPASAAPILTEPAPEATVARVPARSAAEPTGQETAPEPRRERLPFRAVLRRASA